LLAAELDFAAEGNRPETGLLHGSIAFSGEIDL